MTIEYTEVRERGMAWTDRVMVTVRLSDGREFECERRTIPFMLKCIERADRRKE